MDAMHGMEQWNATTAVSIDCYCYLRFNHSYIRSLLSLVFLFGVIGTS